VRHVLKFNSNGTRPGGEAPSCIAGKLLVGAGNEAVEGGVASMAAGAAKRRRVFKDNSSRDAASPGGAVKALTTWRGALVEFGGGARARAARPNLAGPAKAQAEASEGPRA
jgi:hypothetical protein